MNLFVIIVSVATFLAALLTFLSMVTDWFKTKIPVEFGFLFDNSVTTKLNLSSGDAAKPIIFRFRNTSSTTLPGLVFDIEFMRPLSLSGTDSAITAVPQRTVFGRPEGENFFLIRYENIVLLSLRQRDFRVELNTQDMSPGTYTVNVTVYSFQAKYKLKKLVLSINMS